LATKWLTRDADLPGAFSDFSTVRARAVEKLRAEVLRQNNGSKYFTEGENGIRKTIGNAIDGLSGNNPTGRATGGMVERQASTARYI